MLKRIAAGAAAAAAVTLLAAPAASAAGAEIYPSYDECNRAGMNKVAAAGGTFSGLSYWCEETKTAQAGTAGCPPGPYDCLGNYFILRTRNV